MKDKKKNMLLFGGLILIAIAIVIVIVILTKSDEIFKLSANNRVVASLESGSQSEVDKLIKDDLEEKKYGLKDARVYLNPYGGSPLGALIAFKSDKATSVTITIKGKHDDDIVLNYGQEEYYHYVPVYALYADYENKVEVELSDGTKETFTIPIGIIDQAPRVIANKSETQSPDGLYFITSPINMRSFAVDAYGEIRWYTESSLYHDITFLDNGHMLIGSGNLNSDGLSTALVEIDYIGRVYKTYNIEEGYLNDFFVKKDGNIILASKNKDRRTYSDYIIEIDKNTGKVVKSWDVYKLLEEIDQPFVQELNRSDYFYNSGIEYDENADSLLLTYWGGEFVINLSYKDGSVKWIFSNPENFTSRFDKVLLKASDGFVYPKSMHSASLNGKVLKVFDNGYSTNKNDANSANLVGSYSSANTYEINGNTISLVSTIDEDKKRFSYALGDYEVVGSNEELVLFGRELIDLNYASGVNINDYEKIGSRLIERIGGNTTVDLDIGWATYSVDKVKMSSDAKFGFDVMEVYTTLEPTAKEEVTEAIVDMIKGATEKVPYEFGYSRGIIEHNVLFMSSDEVKLVLVDGNDNGAVYDLKVKGETRSRKIVTDLKSGKYYVYVLENGVMYKTDNFIEIK